MVREYQLTTIVMLTRCVEKGKVKSHSNITYIMLTTQQICLVSYRIVTLNHPIELFVHTVILQL